MDFWDRLSAGSSRHKATKTGSALKITANDAGHQSLADFQQIAEDAMAQAAIDGLRVLPHKSSQVSGGLYDTVLIFFE